VAAFIDSEADSIFRNLFPDTTFQILALQYLCTKAHPDTRRHFSDILRQYGYDQQALRVDPSEESNEKSTTIYVVDDSRMLLKVYKSNLHEIGFVSKLFEFPESAIEHILNDKPDLVITDLNMPKITGLELTRQVREVFAKEQLPIILITTQSDQDETASAYKAGVNDVVYKPFTKEILKERINHLIL
jgi:PleD family two-component response regulator